MDAKHKRIKASKSDPAINYGLDTFKMFGWLVESALPIKSIWNWFQSWARSLAAFDTLIGWTGNFTKSNFYI